jgi:hypothetical protein
MFNQYFGNYLLNKGLLSPDSLADALSRERSVRPKLGVLAIDAGLMTAAQVEEVHQLQHSMDKRFGEIALERRYLHAAQLEELLAAQQTKRLSLSQAIVDSGYLSLAELETALENYKRDNKFSAEELAALHNADIDAIVRSFLDFSAGGPDADLLYDYVALIIRHIVRFLGAEPVIAPAPPADGWLITQELTGPVSVSTGLAMNDALLVSLAGRYSGEPISQPDELARDSIGEFLNEANGIFAVNMSDRGLELDLKPQRIGRTQGVDALQHHCRVSLQLLGGHVDLYLALG